MTKRFVFALPYMLISIMLVLVLSLGMINMLFDKNFKYAIEYVLQHEGGFSNDIKDSGGETKYGISQKYYPNINIKSLTLDEAKEIYYRDFWKPQAYRHIEDPKIATKVFDLAVNAGPVYANKVLQRSLRSLGFKIKEDSVLGPETLKAVNESDATLLMTALKSESAGHYRTIAAVKPKNDRFLKGWLRRAYSQPL